MINIFKASESSMNRAIVFSISMSMAAKILNFGQSVVVSYAFGTSESTDLLFYCLSIVIMLTTFQGAVNHQVVIPVSIDLRKNFSPNESDRFLSYIYIMYAFLGLLSVIVLLAFPETIISVLSRFSKEAIANNMAIIRLIIPSLLLIILNTYMLDILTSYRYFTFPMILDMVKNLVIIIIVLLFKDMFKEESLSIGILLGNLAQFFVLTAILIIKIKLRLYLKRYKINSAVKKNITFVVAGRVSTMVNDFVMIYLLSGFSVGVFSAMDYAFKIDTVLNMVVVGQITTVIGIKIIELYSESNFEGLTKVFRNYLGKSLFFIVPMCFIISLNARPIISLLFERGSFDSNDADITSMFLSYFVLTVPLELINGFVVILIIAKQIQKKAFKWQIFQSVLNIGIVWVAVSNFGYRGYPVAIMVSLALYVFLLVYFLLKSEFWYIGPWVVLKPYIVNLALNLIIFLPAYFICNRINSVRDFAANLFYIGIVSFSYIAVYLMAAYLSGLHKNNIEDMLNGLKRLLRKNRFQEGG